MKGQGQHVAIRCVSVVFLLLNYWYKQKIPGVSSCNDRKTSSDQLALYVKAI